MDHKHPSILCYHKILPAREMEVYGGEVQLHSLTSALDGPGRFALG